MAELIRNLQKNIFLITSTAGVILGLAMAYATTIGIGYYLRSSLPKLNLSTQRRARPAPQRRVPDVESFEGVVTGAFFRSQLPLAANADAATPTVQAGEITVLGVITGSWSSARTLIQEKGKEPDAFAIGETVAGYKITGIHKNYVSFLVGETPLRINVGEKSEQATAAAGPARTKSSGPVQKVTLSRERLKKLITGNQADFLKNNKWTAKIHNGKIIGIKLVYLNPQKSFLYQLGARPGDILRRFNGEKLENQAKMIQLFQSLMTQDKITVDIERAGKILTYEIIIQ